MALSALLGNLVQSGTNAVSAYDAGKARRSGREREDMMLRRKVEQENEDRQRAELAFQQEQEREKILLENLGLQQQQMERELNAPPRPMAPVQGTPEYYEHLRRELGIRDEFDARESQRRARAGGGASSGDNMQKYLQRRLSELTKQGREEFGLPVAGLSPEAAIQQARQEWALINGQQGAPGALPQAHPSAPVQDSGDIDLREGEDLTTLWDDAANSLRQSGATNAQIVQQLGRRPGSATPQAKPKAPAKPPFQNRMIPAGAR